MASTGQCHQQRTKVTKNVQEAYPRFGGSILFTILLLGLVFSLIAVFYMVLVVEVHYDSENPFPRTHSVDSTVVKRSQGIDLDRRPIFEMLRHAGVDPTLLDNATIEALPTWPQVVKLYGDKPVIYGLDQCHQFQMNTKGLGFIGTAGTFNSGTNLMSELLIANCHMQERMNQLGPQNRGIRWQVPWGKHSPPRNEAFRQGHKTKHDANVNATDILPIVTIRDPLTWLVSMCHHPYAARWEHSEKRCPDFSLPNLKAKVKYAEFVTEHESILGLWNSYYGEYIAATFPRLIVRLEDLVFHPEEVTTAICHCAGGSMRANGKFKYVVDSAKKGDTAHGKDRTGFVDAMIKYGSETQRYKGYKSSLDLLYVRNNVDKRLMDIMQYPLPEPQKANEEK